jgi:LuxR family transcriptional regulator, maltose regulon positive regulatory protein
VPVLVHNHLGMAALLSADLAAADRHLRAAVSVEFASPPLSQLNAAAYLALLRSERGELDAAEVAALDVIRRAAEAGLEHTPQVVGAYLAMARVALDRADHDEVDDWLGRVAAVEAVSAEPHVRVEVALVLAARREAAGNRERALSGLRATVPAFDLGCLPPAVQGRWLLTEATLLARLGDRVQARALVDQLGPEDTGPVLLACAALLLELGDRPAAAAARARVEPPDHPRARVHLGVLDTALALAAGDDDTALNRLEDALAAAAPWSLRHPFLTHGAGLRPLLERRVERGTVVPAFAVDLLQRIAAAPGAPAAARRALIDPLTDRERTILRYLGSTLSNADIAAELYVSVNTVKTHQRSLYRKLGVDNRREAVVRARALNLR